MGPQPPQSIRPDAFVDVALPPANPLRQQMTGQRPRSRQPAACTRNLIDVKTVYGGTTLYCSFRAAHEQCGAVDMRAEAVDTAYKHHARKIDNYSYRCAACPVPRSTGPRCVACSTHTPIAAALASHGVVRGAVFGQYGEASLDVHSLVDVAAREMARTKWRTLGARSQDEAYAFFVATQRRSLGVAVVREFARHRLRRLAFIGASVAQVQQARDDTRSPTPSPAGLSPEEADFFRFLQGRGGGA